MPAYFKYWQVDITIDKETKQFNTDITSLDNCENCISACEIMMLICHNLMIVRNWKAYGI